jgi:hypothetical protein
MNPFWNFETSRVWLIENRLKVDTFLYQKVPFSDRKSVFYELVYVNPLMGRALIESYFKPNQEKISEFLNIVSSSSLVVIECGKRKSGKTVFNLWLSEYLVDMGFSVYYINPDFNLPVYMKEISYNPSFPYLEIIKDFYPEVLKMKDYVKILDYLRRNPNKLGKVFIFHDECHKDLPKNVALKEGDTLRSFWAELRKIFNVLTVVYTSQTLSGIPVQLFNYADMQVYKTFNFWQLSMDRQQIVEAFAKFIPEKVDEVLIVYDTFLFFNNPLPRSYA